MYIMYVHITWELTSGTLETSLSGLMMTGSLFSFSASSSPLDTLLADAVGIAGKKEINTHTLPINELRMYVCWWLEALQAIGMTTQTNELQMYVDDLGAASSRNDYLDQWVTYVDDLGAASSRNDYLDQ